VLPVEVTFWNSGPFSIGFGKTERREGRITFSESRVLIGWSPWIGVSRGTIFEGHIALYHRNEPLFVRGPHKEAPFAYYDVAGTSDFFPSECGRFVELGEGLGIEVVLSNTGSLRGAEGHGNARIYTVKTSFLS